MDDGISEERKVRITTYQKMYDFDQKKYQIKDKLNHLMGDLFGAKIFIVNDPDKSKQLIEDALLKAQIVFEWVRDHG